MNIVLLQGGLGNQMFQYAFGMALENITGDTVYFDDYTYPNMDLPLNLTKWKLGLGNFELILNSAPIDAIRRMKKRRKSLVPWFIRIPFNLPKYKSKIIRETKENVYEPELFSKKGYFEGYFQTEKYFKTVRKQLLRDFSLKTPLDEKNKEMLEKIKNTKNSVSLHVRRGDYVNLSDVHFLCDLDYYRRAIKRIANRVGEPHFFLFSDDPNWVKENLKIDYPYTVVDINSSDEGYFDLELMKNCEHNIIANSSFSWWGAWLNQNNRKIVIAPLKWHKDNQNKEWDIFPDGWIVL